MLRAFANLTLLALCTVPLSACSDYANQTDAISYGAGYAMQQNMAIHRADPYPRYGAATDILTDGKRAVASLRQSPVAEAKPVAVAAQPQ